MVKKPNTIKLLAAAFLAVGLVGFAAFWVALLAWLRTAGTSPLATLFALAWSCAFVGTAVLTWHRSRLAAPVFLVAMGLLLYLLSFLFPGGQLLLLPLFVVIFGLAFLGYQYLHRTGKPAA